MDEFKLTSITKKRLILGEGARDAMFLSSLCKYRGIDEFQISHVKGYTTFGTGLDVIRVLPDFDKLTALLIFGDNDADVGKTFDKIKEQLNNTQLPSPPRPLHIARKQNCPPTAVVMMPFSHEGHATGALETMLIPAIERAHPVQKGCVDTLITCSGVDKWKARSARDKLLVRCTLSASCEENPMCGHNEWFRSSSNLIPLDDEAFIELGDFLANVPAWFDSGLDRWTEWLAGQNP